MVRLCLLVGLRDSHQECSQSAWEHWLISPCANNWHCPGRPLRSCQQTFDEMRRARRTAGPPTASPSYQQPFPNTFPFPPQPPPAQLPPVPPGLRKRPFQELETTPTGASRLIQPRPSGTGQLSGSLTILPNTEITGSVIPSPSETGDEPSRKKRGRPSKDEIQRREAEAAARGEVYAPKKRAPRKSGESSTKTTGAGPTEGMIPLRADSNRMPLQLSPTTQQVTPSGKRAEQQQSDTSAGDPMEMSHNPTESKSFHSYPAHVSESAQFTRRSSPIAPSPVPRYQPLAPSSNPLPPQTSPETPGSNIRSTYPSLYETQATSRHWNAFATQVADDISHRANIATPTLNENQEFQNIHHWFQPSLLHSFLTTNTLLCSIGWSHDWSNHAARIYVQMALDKTHTLES